MWVILGVLAVLLFLLFLPVTVEVAYQQELSLRVQYLFWKLGILPAKEKQKKPKAVEKKATEEPTEEKPKKKKSITVDFLLEILELLKQALSSLKNPLGWFLRKLRYRDIWLHITAAKEDAHQTALFYGQCQALVHTVFSLLEHCIDIKTTDIQIQSDFCAEEGSFSGGAKLKVRPLYALIFALWFVGSFGLGYVKRKWTESKLEKELKEQCNKQKERKE